MYVYNDIAFRTIEEEDLDALREIHNDPTTYSNLLNIDLVDENNQISWWKSLHKNKNDLRYVICLKDKSSTVLGRLRIQNINYMHNNCEVGLDIKSSFRGKGYGKKSYQMLLDFLFNHYNMNMIYLRVADFNPEGKKLYQKVGFEETGFFPNFFFRNGKYSNYIIMSMTKDRYLSTQIK